ncbi:hypothetical protein K0M31_007336, partial [Melipona bicolor]
HELTCLTGLREEEKKTSVGRATEPTRKRYHRENGISPGVYSIWLLRNTSPCEERTEGGAHLKFDRLATAFAKASPPKEASSVKCHLPKGYLRL